MSKNNISEKLLEMLNMQERYNKAVLEKHDSEKYTSDNLECALLDEIGELNHELKANWCWWKTTQKPVNRDKVLEEYVDCIHFGLCLLLNYVKNNAVSKEFVLRMVLFGSASKPIKSKVNKDFSEFDYIRLIKSILVVGISATSRFKSLLNLGYLLGFSFDDIYDAYKAKNSTNYDRLHNGY